MRLKGCSNLAAALALRARAAAERPFFLHRTTQGRLREYSYGQFLQAAQALALKLRQKGLRPGQRVALVGRASFHWCAAFLGALWAQAVVVPLNEALGSQALQGFLEDSGASCLIKDPHVALKQPFCLELSEALFQGPPLEEPPEEGGLALILYTSGTTATAKGVALSHENLLSDAQGVLASGLLRPEDRVLQALPLYHAYPLMCSFLAPALAGSTVVGLASPREFAQTVRQAGVSKAVVVPQMLELLLERLRREMPLPLRWLHSLLIRPGGHRLGRVLFSPLRRKALGGLETFASGGARLSPQVMLALEALGFVVIEGYGLTECSPVVSFNPLRRRKPGSVGLPIQGAEVKLQDGEVLVRGPMLMQGYWRRPQETAQAIRQGWLFTGDLGRLDEEGYLYITGRKKELLVLASGKNVQPEEVEEFFLRRCPLLKEIGVYEAEGTLKAVVVPHLQEARRQGLANVGEALRWQLMEQAQGLPEFLRPKGFVLTTQPLPRTPLGKLRRYMLRELGAQEMRRGRLPEGPLAEPLQRAFRKVLPQKTPVYLEDHLELSLGLDSLRRLELLTALSQELSLALPDDFLQGVQTVEELMKRLEQPSAAPAPRAEARPLGGMRALKLPLLLLNRALVRAFFPLQVEGLEHLPPGPFILAPNHVSFLDGFVLSAALPLRLALRLHFQGLERYFRGPLRLLARAADVLLIDREGLLAGALRASTEALRQGRPLCIFPEGGRSFDGQLMELKRGIAELALQARVPIVPAWVEGTFRALPRGRALPRLFSPVRVRIGRPLSPQGPAPLLLRRLRETLLALRQDQNRVDKRLPPP
jgi:long-chain acyl-CoA synthetase